jgi:hypothetical protein
MGMINEVMRDAKRMTWKEYVQGLDLSHWSWFNTTPWSDRKVYFLSDELIIYPVYAEDIMDDVGVSYEFLDDGLAISWDNFQEDCTVLVDIPQEPVGYLLLEEVDEGRWELVVDKVFTEAQEIKEFLQEYLNL